MKKTLLLVMVFALLLSLCACGSSSASTKSNTGVKTTAPVQTNPASTPSTEATSSQSTTATAIPHTHNWVDADCTTPKTCSICNATEGSATGHDWKSATCTTPKTCRTCRKSQGNAAGHKWNAATCTTPKTCKVCSAVEGTATDHSYKNSKCTTCGDYSAYVSLTKLNEVKRYLSNCMDAFDSIDDSLQKAKDSQYTSIKNTYLSMVEMDISAMKLYLDCISLEFYSNDVALPNGSTLKALVLCADLSLDGALLSPGSTSSATMLADAKKYITQMQTGINQLIDIIS